MKMVRFFLTLISFAFIFSLTANAQQDSLVLANILNKTKKLADEQPFEKVYLHFDKPYYAVADTIWYKAYLTAEQNVPSPLSKIVYVELWNAQDSLIHTQKLPVSNSMAFGNIPLNMQNFKQGNYYVRAYTMWMLNFSDAFFFTKTITVGEAIDKQLITNITFSNEQNEKEIKTTAKIQFKDINKKVYANKTVNWKVLSNFDVYTRGKATTDQNGFLNIVVNSKIGEAINNGQIVTDIGVSDKETLNASFKLKQSENNIDFQFFPEGGQLVSEIPQQIAFKALKPSGLGVEAKGVILDEQNIEITSFASSFAGMGSFFITPDINKSYKAKVTFKDGSTKTYNLPKVNASGINLQVASSNAEFLTLKIIANAAFYESNANKSFFVVAQSNKVVYYAAQTNLKNQLIVAKIPKKNFPSGIIQITLFNSNSEPISERLSFILHPNDLNIAVKTDLPVYKPRQKVKMTLEAKSDLMPVSANFSVAVTDEQKVPIDENTETTILSSLLLTSDLAGYVEKPNYYFNKTDEKKLADLDKLMLTQGYRKFVYKEILADVIPEINYLPEQGMNITGILRDRTGMPIKKGSLRLMVTGKPISAETITSNMGLFNFQNLVFPDSSEVVVSAKYNPNAANLMIMIDGTPTPGRGKNVFAADEITNIDTVLSAYLANNQKQYRYMRTLKQVEIKGAAVKKPSHADHATLSGLSNPDHLLTGDRFNNGCALLLNCLRGMAPGLTFDQEDFFVTRDYNQGTRIRVQSFINGTPVDTRELNNVQVTDIESIEIFLVDVLGTIDRTYSTRGVLVVNTKKAPVGKKISKEELMNMLPKTNIINYKPMGYSKEREFYSPKYLPNLPITNSDLRTTIYWNPKLVTDEKGNTTFEFFNADGRGNYKAVVEGIDKNGNIGRAVYRYIVK